MTMPWLASQASPSKYLNTPTHPTLPPASPSSPSCSITNAITSEIHNVRSALEGHFTGKPPRTPVKSPYQHHAPEPRRPQPEAARVHPLTFSERRPYHNAPRTADPRLCQFPTTPRSSRPSTPVTPSAPAAPATQAPVTSLPYGAYSISERKVINLDDPPRYEAKPTSRLERRGAVIEPPARPRPQSPSQWPNEKTPVSSPHQPRRPPQQPWSGGYTQPANHHIPHTAHPLGAFPRHSPRDGYHHRSPRGYEGGPLSANPEGEGKRSFFDFKFTIPSPFSSGKNTGSPSAAEAPRSATPGAPRPRDTRRFGYYEYYKTPVTGQFEMQSKGRGYDYGADQKTPADVMFDVDCKTPIVDDDISKTVDLEKGADAEKRKSVSLFESWRAQFKDIGERLKRKKSGRIPSFDAEAEPQTLEQIEKNLRASRVLAWTTLAGAWLMQFATFGYIWSWNVFQDYYMNHHAKDHSIAKLSWVGGLQLSLCFALAIVSGKLLDGGKFYVSTMVGSLIFGMGVFALSFVDPSKFFQLFVVQGLFMGTGLGFVFLPSATICMFHFKEKKALMTGIAMSGSAFGAMVFPIMLDGMLDQKGFQGAVRGSSYLVIAMLVIANCLIAKPPKVWAPKFPPVNLIEYMKERHYYLVCAGIFVTTLALWFPQNYIEEYAVKHNFDINLSFYTVAVMGVAGLMGRIALGVAADRLGAWNLLIPATGGVFLMTCSIPGIRTPGSVVVVSLFYGFFSGAWLSLLVTALASLAVRPGEIGHRVGLALAAGSLGAFISIPLHAALVGKEFMFNRAIGLSVFLLLVATAIFVYVRMLVAGRRRFQYV